MKLRISTERLARASSRHPWTTIGIWLVAVIAAGGLTATLLGDALTNTADFTNNPESKRAQSLIEQRLRGEERDVEIVIVKSRSLTVRDAEFRGAVEEIANNITALQPAIVESVQTYYSAGDTSLVLPDGRTTFMRVLMTGDLETAIDNVEKLHEVTIDRSPGRDFTVLIAGSGTIFQDFIDLSEKDARKGEGIGIPVALVVLLVVFGTVVAAILPLVLGVVAIVAALGIVALLGVQWDFSFFVINMITMMGLAVGIDYSLFVVSRYREERRRGLDKAEAIATAAATSSRAVFFSGMTVVLALAGMLLIPVTIFRSLSIGAITVVLMAMAACLTLLPAVLSLLGDRINKGRVPFVHRRAGNGGAGWDRATRAVMRRPVVSVVVSAGVLLLAASQLLGMKTGFSGVSTLPDSMQSKRAFIELERAGTGGSLDPLEIVVDGRASEATVGSAIEALQSLLARDHSFAPSSVEINKSGDLSVVTVPIAGDPNAAAAYDLVRRVRNEYVPRAFADSDATVLVGGGPAMMLDLKSLTSRYTPIVFAFVLGLSFILLMVVFRSIVVPAKAILMNLLSVGAAYGMLVLVNQKGFAKSLTGFQQVETLEVWLPLFLFSVLFGLSMDYHVFLLSRIREHYNVTHDNTESVAHGLRSTAGIITGAALIMVAVFTGFATGELVMMQQMGFGLAVAVLLDATIVRTVLVPSSMRLLGNINWYLPRWLAWLPRVGIETPTLPTEVVDAARVDQRELVASRGRAS